MSDIRETSMAVFIDEDVPLNQYKRAKRVYDLRGPYPLEITVDDTDLMEIL